MAALLDAGGRRAPQQHGVAGLEADPGGVRGHVGPRLVDHPDHAERHPHLPQLQAVGEGAAADHLADRVRQGGHLAQPAGHVLEPLRGQPEPVDDVRRRPVRLRAGDVLGVRVEHLAPPGQQGVGHRERARRPSCARVARASP